MHVCFFVLDLVFSTKPRNWLGRTSLKLPIFNILCHMGRKTSTQSIYQRLQCFDTVECWLGIIQSIRPDKNRVVWSELQMICMWSGWCHCHPWCLASLKPRMVYLSGAEYPVCPGKGAIKWGVVVITSPTKGDGR